MTAVTIDAAVSSSGITPYPNPIPSVDTPTKKDSIDQAAIPAPIDLSSMADGGIGAPSVVSTQSESSVLAPSLIVDIDQPAISLPVSITPESIGAFALPSLIVSIAAANIVAPSAFTFESAAAVGLPSLITDIDQPSINTPSTVTPESESDVLAPSAITDIDQPSINTPSVVPAESVTTAPAPVAITDIDQPAISIPTAKTALTQPDISTPSAINDVDQPAMTAPSLITPIAAPSDAPPFALNHARILYDNLLIGSSVSVTTGTNGDYTLIPNTADRWSFTGGAEITFTLAANVDIDTVCIGAHNLGSNLISVGVEVSNATTGSFSAFAIGQTPLTDSAIMFHRDTTADVRRLKVVCAGTGSLFIGSVYAGIALQMQRPFFAGHTPINLSAVTDYYSSRTESGNFIGREIRSREFSTSASWNNIGDTWYRTYFQPFVISAKTLPFYFAWNLDEHPLDVGYCMTNADIAPTYSGTLDLFSLSFDLVGLA